MVHLKKLLQPTSSALAVKPQENASETLAQARNLLSEPRAREMFWLLSMNVRHAPTNSLKAVYQLNRTPIMCERPITDLLEILLGD